MPIPCECYRATDALPALYLMFLRHRERPQIVSSDRGTHFTGEVYRNFCELMGIKQELHCPWRPQSSGNVPADGYRRRRADYVPKVVCISFIFQSFPRPSSRAWCVYRILELQAPSWLSWSTPLSIRQGFIICFSFSRICYKWLLSILLNH